MRNLLMSALFVTISAGSAQAMSVAEMKKPGTAIKWREMDLTLRNDIITDYVMNVDVPSGDIDQSVIGDCMMQELKPYAKLQPLDKKGPSFYELMKKCVK